MSESMQKFKEIADKAETIAVRLGGAQDIAKALAGALLHQTFLKAGKKSHIDSEGLNNRLKNCVNILFKENILIKLSTKGLPVSSLKYERDGDTLKIILESPESKSFDPKTVSVEKETVPADLLLLIDPTETEKETLALLGRLLDQNLAHEKIKKAKEALRPSDFWKLFGRALARSSFEKETATTWAFLPKTDFTKTNFFVKGFATFSEAELKIRSYIRRVL